ncbi:MAG: hypothetical protein ABS81_03025 [Pseudonocardia sp. SCN 72-86]|nr:MAG: hypothetical protein ABS81_03025 [Pseudonocardia sp. SCN 72-86]
MVRTASDRHSFLVAPRSVLVGLLLTAVIVAIGVAALLTGQLQIPFGDVVDALFGEGSPRAELVIGTLRLPRLLTGILVGAALGVSGAIFQSLSRNPLGSPDIIGFTSGSATGAVLSILFLRGDSFTVAAGAVLGGIASALLVYALAFRGGVQGFRLILVGIGVSALLTSINTYILLKANLRDAQSVELWLTGSLNGRSWEHVLPVAVALLVLLPVALALGRRMTLLEMGDDSARARGVPVERTRLTLVVLSVALTAMATASAGPIGFIALAAPQVAKRLTRGDGAGLVVAGLMGAALLTAADLASQRLFAPSSLPVGIGTAAVGGVYLAWLLAREWRASRG